MALTTDEIVADLPAVLTFYEKVKTNIAAAKAGTLTVTPPVNTADGLDIGLAVGQSLATDFVGFVRTIAAQVKS